MQKLQIFILILISSVSCYAQSTVSVSGKSVYSDAVSLDYVIGQIAVTPIEGKEYVLHQGVLHGLKIEPQIKQNTKLLDISVWPNPVSNVFHIETQASEISYRLFNYLQQKTGYEGSVPSNTSKSINIDGLQPAVYLLYVSDGKGNETVFKIFKIN